MEALALGVRYPGGEPLLADPTEAELAARIDAVTEDAERIHAAPWVFAEQQPVRGPRLDVPAEAGWSYVVAAADPDHDALVAVMRPLAEHRGMADPDAPLTVPGDADLSTWLSDTYLGMGEGRPHYLLLCGDPELLPYDLQVDLAAAGAMVGRVGWHSETRLDDLAAYIGKVVDLETAASPVPRARATVVATDGGVRDATTYSSRFLSPQVTAALHDKSGLEVTGITGPAATVAAVSSALADGPQAIVFTATHGAAVLTSEADAATKARAVNGAWCCAPADSTARPNDWDVLEATDLPSGATVHGGVVFQFACFGAGTSSHSSFSAWLGGTNDYDAAVPFVAAIPRRLLASPEGPIAYISHVDIAVAHGFIEPGVTPGPTGHPRLAPYTSALFRLTHNLAPVGYAMRDFHQRAAGLGSSIATTIHRLQDRGTAIGDLPEQDRNDLIDMVIRRNDAMHFLVLGDPAARLRIERD